MSTPAGSGAAAAGTSGGGGGNNSTPARGGGGGGKGGRGGGRGKGRGGGNNRGGGGRGGVGNNNNRSGKNNNNNNNPQQPQQPQQAGGGAAEGAAAPAPASAGRGKNKEGGGGRRGRGSKHKQQPQQQHQQQSDETATKQQQQDAKKQAPEPAIPSVSPEELKAKEQEEQRLKDEARQKALAEKEAAAAEAAQKQILAALREQCQQAVETLQVTVETLQSHQQARATFEEESLKSLRESFAANKKTLKTDLKKCTAFVKKIKSGTAWSMKEADIIKDVASLNLSRYVEEVVTAIVDAKPKVNDVATVVALCQAMHERYPEFLPPLKQQLWQTHIQNATANNDAEATKLRRVFLRIWTELVVRGLVTETKNLVKLMASSAGAPDDKSSATYNVTDPSLIVAFCKQAGLEILGTVPASVRQAMEVVMREDLPDDETVSSLTVKGRQLCETLQPLLSNRAVSDETTKVLHTHCRGAYEALMESLLQTNHKLLKLEKRCEQDRLMSGSLTEAREKGLQDARKLKENLFRATESLADVLDEAVPSLVSESNEDDEGGQGPGIEVLTKADGEADTGPFDDEETRAFYCDVPDLISTLPAALLNLSHEAVKAKQEENARKFGNLTEETTPEEETAELAPLTEEEMEEQEAESTMGKEEEGKSPRILQLERSNNLTQRDSCEQKRPTKTHLDTSSWCFWRKIFLNAIGESRLTSSLNASPLTMGRQRIQGSDWPRPFFWFLTLGWIYCHFMRAWQLPWTAFGPTLLPRL